MGVLPPTFESGGALAPLDPPPPPGSPPLSVEYSDDCVVPTCKHQRICNEEALQLLIAQLCIERPRDRNNPQTSNPLDFFFLLLLLKNFFKLQMNALNILGIFIFNRLFNVFLKLYI